MKIVIISNYGVGNETGVAKVSETISTKLSEKHKIMYVCLGEKYDKEMISKNLTYVKIPSVPIKQGYIPKLNAKIVKQITQDLDKFKPDVIHAQNIIFAALVALVWSIKNKVPFITTLHSMPSEGITWVYPKLSGKKSVEALNYTLKSGYVKRVLKSVDLAIALNKYVKRSIKDVYKNTKVTILNNGLDLKDFHNLENIKPKKTINFLYIGSYMPKKNQEYLTRTFSYLPNNFKLNLYGNKETGGVYVKKLERLVRDKSIENVSIHDFLSYKGVLLAQEKAHYFVSASLKEAQSLVIIEALSAGNPVIGLSNETIDEIIDGKNGIQIPKKTSPKEFAKKLSGFVNKTSEDYLNVSEHARKSSLRFDINTVAQKLEIIYKKEIKAKKKEKNGNMAAIEELIPERFKELFEKLSKYSKPKPLKLRYFLFLTMVVSFLAWPILKVVDITRKKF